MPAASSAVERASGIITAVTATYPQNSPHGIVVNPASPDFVTRLAKTASVYQKFKVVRLSFRYLPSVGTTQNGQVFFCYQPNVEDPVPSNLDEMSSLGGLTQGSVSQPLTVDVQSAALNKAFVVNYTEDTSANLNCAGRLLWAVDNVGNTAQLTLGTLYVDYHFVFSDPKLSYTDQIGGSVLLHQTAAGPFNLASEPDSGAEMFVLSDVTDIFRKRGRQESLLLHYGTSVNSTPTVTCRVGTDSESLTRLAETIQVATTGGDQLTIWTLPAGAVYLDLVTVDGYWDDNMVWLTPHRS